MNRFIYLIFIFTFLSVSCILFAGCTHKWVGITPPQLTEVLELRPATEQIFSCLDNKLKLTDEQRKAEFDRLKESFVVSQNNENRIELICLSLARQDEPELLQYAQELAEEMKHLETPSYPDINGLAALLNYFQHLQKKRVNDVNQARQQVNELKKQLEELKSIEKIINDRKNAN